MASNRTSNVAVTSSGIVTGDDPIHHSLLLLIVQVALVVCLSRLLALLLRPLKQPRVVAEILGGILLGPTGFGNIPGFTSTIFPQGSLNVLETIADVGLIFFLFLVGLELNIKKISKAGVMTIWMAAAGIILPFGLGAIVSYIIFKVLLMNISHSFGAFTMFLGVALSITAFPVLARILAERKLLNTEIGQMAMSAAAIYDVVAWVLLALAVAITNSRSSPLVALWVLLLGIAFLALMFLVVSPIMYALAHYRELPPEPVVAMTLVLVLGAAFLADLIGIHVIFGAFICGLIIPKDGPFTAILIEKVEDYVSVLFLPLYFAASGLKTHLSAINDGTAVLILVMVLATACVGKVLGTFIVAKLWHVENRKAIALGILMNTKGLVELIVLNIGLSKKVINQELFAVMVIMALVTTFMTTPLVMWVYSPARDVPPYARRSIDAPGDELRMLLCRVGSWNIHSMVNMIEITRGKQPKSFQPFVLHLIECSDRLIPSEGRSELEAAFQTYAQLSGVRVKTSVAMSALHDMHIDICNTACFNRVNFLLLPFHIGTKEVILNVLKEPPCSLGLLVDKGLGNSASLSPPTNCSQHIFVLFFGGGDDREALLLARRMVQHGGIKLTVIQFVIQGQLGSMSLNLQTPSIKSIRALKWCARQVMEFFKAPWKKTQKCVTSTKDEVHIFVENADDERLLDKQALAPVLKQANRNLDELTRNVAVRVIETRGNFQESIVDVFQSVQPNGLIITGLHSPCVFPVLVDVDHGLGPLGDFLVSKAQASVLLVRQHNYLQGSDKHASPVHVHPSGVEEMELGSSISSVDTSLPSVNRDGYHSDGALTSSREFSGALMSSREFRNTRTLDEAIKDRISNSTASVETRCEATILCTFMWKVIEGARAARPLVAVSTLENLLQFICNLNKRSDSIYIPVLDAWSGFNSNASVLYISCCHFRWGVLD